MSIAIRSLLAAAVGVTALVALGGKAEAQTSRADAEGSSEAVASDGEQGVVAAGWIFGRRQRQCPPSPEAWTPGTTVQPTIPTPPGTTPSPEGTQPNVPQTDDLSPREREGGVSPGDLASTRGYFPQIIGDALVPASIFFSQSDISQQYVVVDTPAFSLRNLKLVENNSPFPRDRVFFNHHYFNNAILGPGATMDVNRYLVGAEKTFGGGWSSLECRLPFASTLNSDQNLNGTDIRNTEFGNVGFVFKRILRANENAALAAGLGCAIPTADNARVFDGTGAEFLEIDNFAVHLVPYIALANRPTERTFWQTFAQIDLPTNGNPVYANFSQSTPGPGLPRIGTMTDQTLCYLDTSFGYWLYRDPARTLTGIAPTIEFHYTTTLNNADQITDPTTGTLIGSAINRFDLLNMTFGTHFTFARGGDITPAIIIPLRTGLDRGFDYEIQTQVNFAF
jgi:hypothetical protein